MTPEQQQQHEADMVKQTTRTAEISLEKAKIAVDDLMEYYIMTGDQGSLDSVHTIKLALNHLIIKEVE